MSRILVGTASWTDKTLLASGWYPPEVKTAGERLAFYARQFPLVEVDSTYYTPPNERNSVLWAARTPPGFTFNVKAFSLLTTHPTRVGALYKDLRPETAKRTVYLKDLDADTVNAIWDRFVAALLPLHEADRLGALLFQFPQWFPIGKRNKHYILECKRRAEPLRICVEFRNASWMSEDARAETLDFLASYAIPYVCVDNAAGAPQLDSSGDRGDREPGRRAVPWAQRQVGESRHLRALRLPLLGGRAGRVGAAGTPPRRGCRHGPRAAQQLLPRLRPGQRPATGRPAPVKLIDWRTRGREPARGAVLPRFRPVRFDCPSLA